MMDWREIDLTHCGLAAAVRLLGDRWSFMILRDVMNGVRRFDDLAEHVGVSSAVLSDRLRKLCSAGLLEQVEYQEPGQRARSEYRLTPLGWDLRTTTIALSEFGYRNLIPPEHRMVDFIDRESGQPVTVKLIRDDGEEISADSIRTRLHTHDTSKQTET